MQGVWRNVDSLTKRRFEQKNPVTIFGPRMKNRENLMLLRKSLYVLSLGIFAFINTTVIYA